MNKYGILYLFVFALSLFLTVAIESKLIPFLKRRASQPIYEEGPSWHMTKSGTPTMGGVAFVIGIGISVLFAASFLLRNGETRKLSSLLLILGYSVANSAIGIIDDLTKLHRRENAGLAPWQKLLLQFILATVFLYLRTILFGEGTDILIGDLRLELGLCYYPIALIALLGAVNCANLTDGIDGLASSVALTGGCSLLFFSAVSFLDVAVVSSALVGGMLGFLFFNINPARIFMGDTGSLFLGGVLASCAFAAENPLLIIFIGGVYLIEGLSVIVQVAYFKLTKKRLFKMAPVHHHLEKCGFSETKICMIAILFTLLSSVAGFLIYGI